MNEEKITTEFIQHKNGITIAKSDLITGKVVINNIEITSIEDWNKVTHSIVELQQENARLKDKLKDIEKILNSNHDVEHIYCALSQYLNIFDYELDLEDYLKEN